MSHFRRYLGFFLTLSLGCVFAYFVFNSDTPPAASHSVEHIIDVRAPDGESDQPQAHTLHEIKDAKGDPFEYMMIVESVFCSEEVCDVVPLRLYWDPLGNYKRYQTFKGKVLTKDQHMAFTQDDHQTLHQLLLDKNSTLKDIELSELTIDPHPQEVDAITSATIMALKEIVVPGAGKTCYHLWHWANGDMVEIIRTLTHNNASPDMLRGYLKSQNNDHNEFALKALEKRRIHSPATLSLCKDKLLTGHDEIVPPALSYLQQASSPQDFYSAVEHLFSSCDSKKRVLILEFLHHDSSSVPGDFYSRLSHQLPQLESYYEVQLFLSLLEKRKISSTAIDKQVMKLLDHDNFFIARRAYNHLIKQKLSPALKSELEKVHSKFDE